MKFLGGVVRRIGKKGDEGLELCYGHHIEKLEEISITKGYPDEQLLDRKMHTAYRSVLGQLSYI